MCVHTEGGLLKPVGELKARFSENIKLASLGVFKAETAFPWSLRSESTLNGGARFAVSLAGLRAIVKDVNNIS